MVPLFIPLRDPLMAAEKPAIPAEEGWSIARAEELLGTLTGVMSVRVVARPGGEIEEVHLLTTEEVAPKQTVRNVESALLAHFGREVDHRKISVAQTTERLPGPPETAPSPAGRPILHSFPSVATDAQEERILFLGHQMESGRSHRVRMQIAVQWKGERFEGEAEGADLPRPRLETIAHATLRAVESAVRPRLSERMAQGFGLTLDGVKVFEAFDRSYALISVTALSSRDVTALAGAAVVDDSPDRAVILATLQATDRWVRGRI